MIRILFVCTGNTCRSPMAEFVMKDLLRKKGLASKLSVDSAGCQATTGMDLSNSAKLTLKKNGIPFTKHKAAQFTTEYYAPYDYLIGFERKHVDNIRKITGGDPYGKVHLLMEFTGSVRDISDPFLTNDYDKTYVDILSACNALLDYFGKMLE